MTLQNDPGQRKRPRSRRLQILFTVVLVVVFVAITFGPLLLTFGWHVIHGSTISCGGREVKVPWRWYPSCDYRTLYLWKLSSTVWAKRPMSGAITISPVLNPPKNPYEKELQYQAFEKATRFLDARAAEIRGPFRTSNGSNEQVCMEVYYVRTEPKSILCLLFKGTWNARLDAPQDESATFRELLRTIK